MAIQAGQVFHVCMLKTSQNYRQSTVNDMQGCAQVDDDNVRQQPPPQFQWVGVMGIDMC